jgi:hypothetical protein
MIKLFLKLIALGVFLSLITVIVVTIVFGIDDVPIVDHNKTLTYGNIKKAEKLIKNNKPGRLSQRTINKLSITEDELNILTSYAISHGLDTKYIFAKTSIFDKRLNSNFTIKLPVHFFGDYINLSLIFKPKNNLFELESCQIGQLKIPTIIINPIISQAHQILLKGELYNSFWNNTRAIKQIIITKKAISFYYDINPSTLKELEEKGRSFLIPDEHQKKLVVYYNHLFILTQKYKYNKNASLDLLKALFAFAQNNTNKSGNPVLENTIALQILSLYTINQRLDPFLKPEYRETIKLPARTKLLFHNRLDSVKHFFVSAALTVSGGSKFASFIGLAKEIDDSQTGSGFSFADLAADKAGVRFGEHAIASFKEAILFQKKISTIQHEKELIPSISNLPEGIKEIEFKRQYKDLDSKAYELIDTEINKRLNQCRLY